MMGLKNYFKTSIKKGEAPGRVLPVSYVHITHFVFEGFIWKSDFQFKIYFI